MTLQVVPGDLRTASVADDTRVTTLPGDTHALAFYGTKPIAYDAGIDVAKTNLAVVAGTRSSLVVRSFDKYGNAGRYVTATGPETYKAQMTGVNQPVFNSTLLDSNDGSYELVFETTKTGVFGVSATLGGSLIASLTNETVFVQPGEVFPPLTTFTPGFEEGGPTPGTSSAGTAIQWTLQARDSFGNKHTKRTGESFALAVTSPVGAAAVGFDEHGNGSRLFGSIVVYAANADTSVVATKTFTVEDDAFRVSTDTTVPYGQLVTTGTYDMAFTPYVVGSYQVSVTHVGSGVLAMEPRTVSVTPGVPDTSSLDMFGAGASGGVAGFQSQFNATVEDAFGNQVVDADALRHALTFEVFGSVGDGPPADVTNNTGLLFAKVETGDAPAVGDSAASASVRVSYTLESVGVYWLVPRVGGTAAHGAPFRLTIARRPAPVPSSATIANDLTHVSVVFDVSTNRGFDKTFAESFAGTAAELKRAKTSCVPFFDPASIASLGGNASFALANGGSPCVCAWRDDKTLVVYFGSKAVVVAGDSLVLLPTGSIQNLQENSFTSAGSVLVANPANPQNPLASISAANVLGPCDGVTLDASASLGGGGRPLRYEFSVSADVSDGYDVTKALDDAHDAAITYQNSGSGGGTGSYPVVRLTSENLDPGVVYTFTAKVTDFVGNSNTATTSVNKTMYPMPNTRVLGAGAGGTRYVRRADDVYVETEMRLPSYKCSHLTKADVGDALSFRWQLVEGPVISGSDFPTDDLKQRYQLSLEKNALFIPRRTLQAGATYVWRLRTSLSVNPSRFYADSVVKLELQSSPISVGLKSGSHRRIFENAPVAMEVAPHDPDETKDSFGVAFPFTISWTCEKESGEVNDSGNHELTPCVGLALPDAFLNGESLVNFPPNALTPGSTYVFTVTVQKEPLHTGAGRVVTETMFVTVLPASGNVVAGISPHGVLPALTAYGPATGTVSVTNRLAIRAATIGCGGGFSFVNSDGTGMVNASDVLVATSNAAYYLDPTSSATTSAYTCLGVVWSVVAGDMNTSVLISLAESGVTSDALTIAPNSLTPGSQYTFRATAVGAAMAGATADVTVVANAAPRGGRLSAEQTADELLTEPEQNAMTALGYRRFSLRALDFTDALEDYPLRYAFFSVDQNNVLTPLSPAQTSNSLDVLLKPGDETVAVRAVDNKHAVSDSVTTSVQIAAAPPPQPPPPASPSPPPDGGVARDGGKRRSLLQTGGSRDGDKRRRSLLQTGGSRDGDKRRRSLLQNGVSGDGDKRRRSLLQNGGSTSVDVAVAGSFVDGFVAPALALGAAAAVARAVSLYSLLFVAGDGTEVNGTCVADSLRPHHEAALGALAHATATTTHTPPGLEQALCAASDLSADARKVSKESFHYLISILKTHIELDFPTVSDAALRCALHTASNLIAVVRSDCFGSGELNGDELEVFAGDVSFAVKTWVREYSRWELVPGASSSVVSGVTMDTEYIKIAAHVLEPSLAFGGGFPLTVAIGNSSSSQNDKPYASAVFAANASAIGYPFLQQFGVGAGMVTMTSFVDVSAKLFQHGFAPTNSWFHDTNDRLASDLVTLEITHFSGQNASAGVLRALANTNITLSYDETSRTQGRTATVRYFDDEVASVSAAFEYEKAVDAENLLDDIATYDKALIVDPIVDGNRTLNGTFTLNANGTLINATYPPPPSLSPPPPAAASPPAPREGTGVPLGTGWVDTTLVWQVDHDTDGVFNDENDGGIAKASFHPLPGMKTSFAAFMTNARAPFPPSPPPPPFPPPTPPPPSPPTPPPGPAPKSFFLEIMLGSAFGSLLVLFGAIYVYVSRRVNGGKNGAQRRFAIYVQNKKDTQRWKAQTKRKLERAGANEAWELHKRERNRLKVVDWARGKLGLKGKKNKVVQFGEQTKMKLKRSAPVRANEAGGNLIFGAGRGGKVFPR